MGLCVVEATTTRVPLHHSRCNYTTDVLRLNLAILYVYHYDYMHCTVPTYHMMLIG